MEHDFLDKENLQDDAHEAKTWKVKFDPDLAKAALEYVGDGFVANTPLKDIEPKLREYVSALRSEEEQ